MCSEDLHGSVETGDVDLLWLPEQLGLGYWKYELYQMSQSILCWRVKKDSKNERESMRRHRSQLKVSNSHLWGKAKAKVTGIGMYYNPKIKKNVWIHAEAEDRMSLGIRNVSLGFQLVPQVSSQRETLTSSHPPHFSTGETVMWKDIVSFSGSLNSLISDK